MKWGQPITIMDGDTVISELACGEGTMGPPKKKKKRPSCTLALFEAMENRQADMACAARINFEGLENNKGDLLDCFVPWG